LNWSRPLDQSLEERGIPNGWRFLDQTISVNRVIRRVRACACPYHWHYLDQLVGLKLYLDQLVGLKLGQLINATNGTRARSTTTADATTPSAPSRTKILSKRLSDSRLCTRLGSRSSPESEVHGRIGAACVRKETTAINFADTHRSPECARIRHSHVGTVRQHGAPPADSYPSCKVSFHV
jgi:hypothetical protein